MHPEAAREREGLCSVCGMQLVEGRPQQKKDGHAVHANVYARKFWISLALTIPAVVYSGILETLFGWAPPAFPGSIYVPLVFGTAVFIYGGWVFIIGAWRELRGKKPGMMTLISLAIITAYAYSVVSLVLGGAQTLFWELTTLITVMLLGHWMEMRAVGSAQRALQELSKLLPDTAERVKNGATETVPVAALREGDEVLVRPGGKIPADGEVVKGSSEVNEALLTGESKPIAKSEGDAVVAGAINGDGALTIRITKIGEHTFLAGIMRLVEEAQASKSKLQLLADKAAFVLTIIAVTGGLLTFVVWALVAAGLATAFERMVAVLVIACPHALGLAIPLVAAVSTSLAARNGILVRERLALERARMLDTVLFDKTGTLTTGAYGVQGIWPTSDVGANEVLRLAASVNARSEHALARAFVEAARQKGIALSEPTSFERVPGEGVRGAVNGAKVFVGSIRDEGTVPEEARAAAREGKTVVGIVRNDALLGVVALADTIRAESREAVSALHAMGVEVAMITGDAQEVADWVGSELGITTLFAEVKPGEKSAKVQSLQKEGKRVAMVGDGVNDAPALTQADIGIAIGAGTNVAIESAGIILAKNDPRDVVKIIRLSRMTYAKMLQNLFWATGYNVVALPLAAGVLAFAGIVLNPAVAALFMSVSTVIVAFNAILLRKKQL